MRIKTEDVYELNGIIDLKASLKKEMAEIKENMMTISLMRIHLATGHMTI